MIITHELYWKSCCTQCDILVLVHSTVSIVALYCSNKLSLCYNLSCVITYELYWNSYCVQCDMYQYLIYSTSIAV